MGPFAVAAAAAVAAVVVVGTAGLLYHCCSRLCLAEV